MRRGFSLVELMIAVSLLALLAALVLPSAADSLRRGQMARTFDALDDALAEASGESMRTGKPVELSLRPGRNDREGWSLWMRTRDDQEGAFQEDSFQDDAPSEGDRLVAFPADVEIGASEPDLIEQPNGFAQDQSRSNAIPSRREKESIILAIALPDGRAIAGQTLRLDENDGDRSWRLTLRPLSASFGAEQIESEPDLLAESSEFSDDQDWEDQLDEFGMFDEFEDRPEDRSENQPVIDEAGR